MYKTLLENAVKELEFCLGTSPFCDRQRIEKTLKSIKKALTSPQKKARVKSGKNIIKGKQYGKSK